MIGTLQHRPLQINRLAISVYANYDPTRTTALRNQFARAMKLRFDNLCKAIQIKVVDEDCFGLNESKIQFNANPMFAFPRSQDKVTGFMNWLDQQTKEGILEVKHYEQIGQSVDTAWTNMYVQDSYKRGVIRARYELDKAGFNIPTLEETGGVTMSMVTPFHMDRLGLLYGRVFSDLKGITSTMDTQISRVLSQGIADGDNPRFLAKKLVATINGNGVDELGLTDTLGRFIPAGKRAEMLARTEIIRAHHQATIQEYKNWAVEGVIVQGEWLTAQDSRVCEKCKSLEGKVFTLSAIEALIPLHPNCRCIALPKKVQGKVEEIAIPKVKVPVEPIKTPEVVKEPKIVSVKEPKVKVPKAIKEPVSLFDDSINLSTKEMLESPEAQKVLNQAFDKADKKRVIENYLAKDVNYKEGVYYRIEGGSGQGVAGAGKGLYVGRDAKALQKFYNQEGTGKLIQYKGSPKWLDLTNPNNEKIFNKLLQDKGLTFESEGINKLILDLNYDGIRYYDVLATGDEYVLFNINQLKKIEAAVDEQIRVKGLDAAKEAMSNYHVSDVSRGAILDYSGESYGAINSYHRGIRTKLADITKKTSDALDLFLKDAPKVEMVSYRGIVVDELYETDIFRKFAGLKPKDLFFDPAFLSTSYELDTASAFGDIASLDQTKFLFTIEGKNGVLIEKLADDPMEAEVLFSRNSKFEILSVSKNAKEKLIKIKMKEL